MKNSVRGSKTPSKSDSSKQSTNPTSPEQGHATSVPLSYLTYRDHGRYSGRGSNVNFLQKNRQACSHGGTTGNVPSSAAGLSPPRSKIGQAPMIGDALGTPSNKGSSSFMSAGHNGVREPLKQSVVKKRSNLDT